MHASMSARMRRARHRIAVGGMKPHRRSSSLRPTTGSSFPAFAISVRFRVNFDRAVWCSGTSSSLLVPRLKMARDLRIAALIWSSDSPCAHSKISVNLRRRTWNVCAGERGSRAADIEEKSTR
eukprot:364682-Chlamydomonas_euryale.AAC.26